MSRWNIPSPVVAGFAESVLLGALVAGAFASTIQGVNRSFSEHQDFHNNRIKQVFNASILMLKQPIEQIDIWSYQQAFLGLAAISFLLGSLGMICNQDKCQKRTCNWGELACLLFAGIFAMLAVIMSYLAEKDLNNHFTLPRELKGPNNTVLVLQPPTHLVIESVPEFMNWRETWNQLARWVSGGLALVASIQFFYATCRAPPFVPKEVIDVGLRSGLPPPDDMIISMPDGSIETVHMLKI